MDRYGIAGTVVSPRMVEDTDGCWVKYSDVEKLQARVRELEGALKEVKEHLDPTDDWMGDVTFWEYIDQALKGGA